MIAGIANKWLVIAAAFIVAVGLAYVKGRVDGVSIGAGKAVKEIIADNKEWNNALSQAERLDAFDRCVALGGLPDDCEVLLRDKQTSSGQ